MPWLTPNEPPEETDCRRLLIPANSEWLALISGALTELTYAYNWQEFGDLTPAETVTKMREIIDGYYDEPCSTCTLPGGGKIIRIGAHGHIEELGDDSMWHDATGDYVIPPPDAREGGTEADQICLAAKNAVNVLQQLYETLSEAWASHLSEAEAGTEFIIAAGAIIGFEFAPITLAIVAFLEVVFAALYTALEYLGADLWTEDFSHQLECFLIECASNAAGVVTFDWDCLMAKLNSLADDFLLSEVQLRLYLQVTYILYFIGGIDGLNLAARTTEITNDDCSFCGDETHFFDFTVDDGGFEAFSDPDTHYTPFIGWESNTGLGIFCAIKKAFSADAITTIILKGTCTDVQGTAGARGWWPNLTASGTEITPGWSGAIGDFAVSWAGSEAIAAGITLGFGSAGGVSTVKHVTIKSICIVTHGDTTLDGDPECV